MQTTDDAAAPTYDTYRPISETNRIQLVLFDMLERTSGLCLAAINKILISLVDQVQTPHASIGHPE
jgi:hypothetical protein